MVLILTIFIKVAEINEAVGAVDESL